VRTCDLIAQLDTLERLTEVVDRVRREETAAGRAGADGSIHTLEVIDRDRLLADPLVTPRVFPLVCSALGWNIHLYHSHIDVHPPLPEPPRPGAGIRTVVARTSRSRRRHPVRDSRSRSRTS
jgi:hypothetical protein